MRTVSFSNRRVQNLLNEYFVNTFINTLGDPSAGKSISHTPNESPGNCVRGNGKQNVQVIFMTPGGDIYHVATGFIPPEDLAVEIEFAGELFAAMKKDSGSDGDFVANAHRERLAGLGFSEQEIEGKSGMEQFAMLQQGLDRANRGATQGFDAANDLFVGFMKGQFLFDNKFSIQNPMMPLSRFQDDPTTLVGKGTSYFGSRSNSSNGLNR